MKRVLAILVAAMLCVSCVVPVMAAENEFTPSVTNKPAPEIVPVTDPDGDPAIGFLSDEDGQIIDYVYEGCLIVTPVSKAETSTEIPDASRTVLLDVYGKLTSGAMTIPYEKHASRLNSGNMVIRDLFDATFVCTEHPEMLLPEGVTLTLTFDLGVKANVDVYAMTYKNSEWDPIVSCENNGDGTVTCVFEGLCPVEFSVENDGSTPTTGDNSNLSLWGLVAMVALLAIVALTVVYRMDSKKRAA